MFLKNIVWLEYFYCTHNKFLMNRVNKVIHIGFDVYSGKQIDKQEVVRMLQEEYYGKRKKIDDNVEYMFEFNTSTSLFYNLISNKYYLFINY